ncbi:MAG TPA: MBL fold metallo-hydrolase [Anaerolineaceae bacterium]|jgi:phosphoribosyl 1,2-cyclic phosphate phosphodiesterase
MQLLFLGSAAAEGYPGLFCNCGNCREARALGGKNIRFRSSLLVNQDLLIDFGPDLLAATYRFNLSLSEITTGLITHAHSDHFYTGNFEMRGKSFTGGLTIPILALYGPSDAMDTIQQAFPDLSELRLSVHTVNPFETWNTARYQITSYQAYHAVGELKCLFYGIDDGKISFLYATDTGNFPDSTWRALSGRAFDVIILEETLGNGQYTMHLGFDSFLEHVHRFREEGLLKPGGRIIAHHMSHSGNPPHEKVEAILGPHGVEVAYDGLRIDRVE